MNHCPCGSTVSYIECCGLYIDGQSIPQTPEALMRSRYTAYSMANAAYIKKTMTGKPLLGFDETEAENWAKKILWLRLNIIKAQTNHSDTHTGSVEFIASFMEEQTIKTIHEISQFQLINGHWLYIDGQLIKDLPQKQKISRNVLCPCGSKKKFKNCHGSLLLTQHTD